MNATANVTRYATGDVRRTCVIPTDPTRTEPTKYSLVTFPSILTKVTRGAEPASSGAPSPPTPRDGMDGLTIPLSDLPSLASDVPCEVELWSPEHPADLIIRLCCVPVAICRVGYDAAMESSLGLCRCGRCGEHFRDGRSAMRIVQVLR